MKCCICGKEFDKPRYMAPDNDVCSFECFSEKLWRSREEEHKMEPFIIVDGSMYSDAGNVEDTRGRSMLGFGGMRFYIEMSDGTLLTTNNLWHGGKVPENHREVMADNAKFLNEKDYFSKLEKSW